MTKQKFLTGVTRAAKYLIAGNPKLSMSVAELQEAARVGKLPPLVFGGVVTGAGKLADDPLAIAIAMKAVVILSERKSNRPTAAQLSMREQVMAAAFRHVCRQAA